MGIMYIRRIILSGEKRRTCLKKVGSLFIAIYLFKSIFQIEVSNNYCILIIAYVHNKWIFEIYTTQK